nr:hypothetical protein [Tanacetum cinerariifolium]
MKEKVVPNHSQVKLKKTEVEDHPRIPSISNKTKSVIACNDSLNSRTSNVNAVCATCGKCLVDSNHFACVTKMLNDVNARTKKPHVVPISTRKPKGHANKSVATPPKKKVTSKTSTQKLKSYYRMLYEKTSKTWKWWIEQQCPSAIEIACYTQNRSIIISTHDKMAYHIINDRKPLIKHLHIFGCTCYQTRDVENLDKMKEKRDLCILVGYSTQSKGCRVYNKRTRLIVESIHLRFDKIKEMSETSVVNDTSGLVPQRQKASDYDNPDPVPQLQNVSPSAYTSAPSQQELDLLFGPLYDDFFNAGTSCVNKSSSSTNNSKQRDTPPTTNIQSSTEPTNPTNANAEEDNENQAEHEFINPLCTLVQEVAESSSHNIGNSNVHTFNQP